MRRWPDGLIELVILHLAVFSIASAGGGLGRTGSLDPPAPGAFWEHGAFWEVVRRIAWHNLGALALLVVAGAVFAGVVLFAVNGYVFGYMLVISDAPIVWVWLYVPLELTSFAVGAAASMRLGLGVTAWLRYDASVTRTDVRRSAMAIGLAAAGLTLAALLEGFAIEQAWKR
jgi:hypothetical protein